MTKQAIATAFVSIAALASACEKEPATQPLPDLPVVFGDCASTDVAFVVGPNPQRFSDRDADRDPDALEPRDEPDAKASAPAAPVAPAHQAHELEGITQADLDALFTDDPAGGRGLSAFSGVGGVGGSVEDFGTIGHGRGIGTGADDDVLRIHRPNTAISPPDRVRVSGLIGLLRKDATPGPHRHLLFAGDAKTPGEPYAAGERDPLRHVASELTACLRTTGAPRRGAAAVDLHLGGGRVTSATVGGIGVPAVDACIAAAATHVTGVSANADSLRCPFTFGAMTTDDLPVMNLAPDRVAVAGQPVEVDFKASTYNSHALRAVFMARSSLVTTAGGPAIVEHYPYVLHATDATPMGVVWRVLASVVTSKEDFVLARENHTGWRLLRDLPLPLPPVPFATGMPWNRAQLIDGTAPRDATRPRISMIVTAHQYWLATNDTTRTIARSPNQNADLAAALAELHGKALEIASDDDVPYRDVLGVIDTATKAGIDDWRLALKESLSIKPHDGPQPQ